MARTPSARAPSPLDAYRRDIARRPERTPFSAHDGEWLSMVVMLVRCQPSNPLSASIVRDAAAIGRRILGADAVRRGCRHDPPAEGDPADLDVLRMVAEDIEQLGALELARSMVDALSTVPGTTSLDQGRLLCQRARISWKRGDVDGARDRYRQVEALGSTADLPELRVRAWTGFEAIAQIRGNYPDVERFGQQAAKLADQHGFIRLAALARTGLFACLARRARYGDALQMAWQIFEGVCGEPVAQAEIVANIGRLLLDMGEPRAARAAFARVIATCDLPRIVLPALGGLALASSACKDDTLTRWAVQQVLAGTESRNSPYEFTMALYESAEALCAIGHNDQAAELRATAMREAEAHGYHEVAYYAGKGVPSAGAASAPADAASHVILDKVMALFPETLPERAHLSPA